ncbi:MAG: sulfite exporter TauE/SafE family protein [Defluviitaleaceae bacterium]|nr:sulfite exporter TauE/SafE family protein [Defluviitaleaceae bacterium]MCL2837046.1 sulfite exporter TauE/SafE family protein [Defluviitaleaceae bacterium]
MEEKGKKSLLRAVIGTGAGLLNGLFGSGGGALVVPASRRFLGVNAHEAHASAIAVMLPMTAVSAVFYAVRTRPDIWQVLIVSVGGLAGGFLGAKLLPKLPPLALRRIFGVFIIAAAIKMIL